MNCGALQHLLPADPSLATFVGNAELDAARRLLLQNNHPIYVQTLHISTPVRTVGTIMD